MSRPRILITLDEATRTRRAVDLPTVETKDAYPAAVRGAGGVPLLMAPTLDPEELDALAAWADGLVITGGAFDLDPALYGQTQSHRIDAPKPRRTESESGILRRMLDLGRPVLAICGGMQLLNVILGGTLLQDIGAQLPGALEHEQPHSPTEPHHAVELSGAHFGTGTILVNSTHHQAVDRLGADLVAVGRSPDGVIEAIEGPRGLVGVQWHPELLDDSVSRALYRNLVEQARGARA